MNIRLFKPSLGTEELDNISAAFDRSWVGLGPNVNEFEKKWEDYIGVKSAIGLNSATAALHISLMAFQFPEGKKVLVPSLTFASTACSVLYNRLIPVFVDSDPVTLGMDIEDMKRKFDNDCVAIIAVHYAGHPIPMDELMYWAREKNLRVIEDCAHTTGSLYKGKALGTWGDFGCYSFEEKKLMTTGDGGMIVSNDLQLMRDIKAYRWVGIDKDNWKTAKAYTDANKDAMHWFYEINLLGYKYNMNDLAASIGLAQLKKLDKMNARRSGIIRQYLEGIKEIKKIKPLLPYDPEKYVYQMFGIRVENNRDELMIFLKSKGIATGCHYTPLSQQPLFKQFAKDCDYIEKEAQKFITLPLHADLTNEEIEYILENLKLFNK
jgi:dTDP-4-amino-4,6-dideoxygalactose transaminase